MPPTITGQPLPVGELSKKFKPIMTQADQYRYFVYYGGRAGGKTFSFATCCILKALERKHKILCCREIQDSIAESVHATLVSRINAMGLEAEFIVTRDSIICKRTGSLFLFSGLFRNIEKIKSIPEISICWINEADKASEESLQLLFPTIREQGSIILIEFNPQYEDDAVYRRFIVNKPENALVVNVNWWDNPYVSQTLLAEKDADYAYRPNEAKHIWEGSIKGYGTLIWMPPFKEDLHVRDFKWEEIRDKVNIYMACDPHSHYYSAAVWIAVWPRPDGKSYYRWVIDEWPKWNHFNEFYSEIRKKIKYTGGLVDMSREFFGIEAGKSIIHRYMDSRFAKGAGSSSSWSNSTMGIVQEWSRPDNGGLVFELPPEKIIDIQRDAIKKDMQYNRLVGISALNEPCFYVAPHCKNVIQSLKNHKLEEDSEVEQEKFKDFSDSLRIGWAGMACHPWVDPKPKQRYGPQLTAPSNVGWMG
jgi:phage terminase large subunit